MGIFKDHKNGPRRMRRLRTGLAGAQAIHFVAERLSARCHFNTEECVVLLSTYERIILLGAMDRMRFREVFHILFGITDDIMLDLIFKAFDLDNNGNIDESEWVLGLSTMLRGTPEELIEYAYFVYDINGDGSVARDELSHCLHNCIVPGYAAEPDEVLDCEKDLVEIAMRKLDTDHDGMVTPSDFRKAVFRDPLLITACGPCLPNNSAAAAFLGLVTDQYRSYRSAWGSEWSSKGGKGVKSQRQRTPKFFQ